MRLTAAFFVLAVVVGTHQHEDKKGSLLSHFAETFKTSDNPCLSQRNQTGRCLSKTECDFYGGKALGPCSNSQSHKTCCVFSIGCNGFTSRNLTYFASPSVREGGYPYSGHCPAKIYKLSPEICQLRLDFVEFSLVQPDPANQVCVQDQFWVSGSPYPVPMICGENAGQHMYVDLLPGRNYWELTMITKDSGPVRHWSILTTQIPCGVEYKAPFGCLQYFRGASGTLQSFNFDLVKITPTTPGRQLSKQDYTICIRTEAGYCGIAYSACPDNLNSYISTFTVSGRYGNGYSGLSDGHCLTDWIIIANGRAQGNPTYNSKFCGTSLQCGGTPGTCPPQTIYSYSIPFEVRFHSNAYEATKSGPLNEADSQNMGFCLDYQQLPCDH